MKLILLCSCIVMTLTANAQFMQGDKIIGGSFSINVQNSSGSSQNYENKRTSFGVNPSIGLFVNDKYAIGGGLGYSYDYSKATYDPGNFQKFRGHSIGIHTYLRRYIMISDKFFLTVTGKLNYGRGIQKEENNTTKNKNKNYSVSMDIYPSLVFFPSKNWGIEGSIGNLNIQHSRSLSFDSKNTSFNFDYGTFFLGFAYYLRRQEE